MQPAANSVSLAERKVCATVFVVDDDPDVRKCLSLIARSVDLEVETFAAAQEFLDRYETSRPGCLVLDVRMPGMSGLELQELLTERRVRIPVIFISAYGEIPLATQAMRSGALDFLQKPFSVNALLERINEAIRCDLSIRHEQAEVARFELLKLHLTDRECEVMSLLAAGKCTKAIASQLSISSKTVDNHRAKVLEKMQVESAAELAALVAKLQSSTGPKMNGR